MDSNLTHKQFEGLLKDLPKVFKEVQEHHAALEYALIKAFEYIHSEQAEKRLNSGHLAASYEFKEMAKLVGEDFDTSQKRINHIYKIIKQFNTWGKKVRDDDKKGRA